MSHNGDSSDSDGIMEEEVHREVKSKLSMREQHHRVIINVLSMERPVITPEMVHYLSQDEACAIFIGFITRLSGSKFNDNPIHNGPAENIPTSNGNKNRDVEEVSPDLVRSYRATMLLTNDDSTEALMLFLGTKSKLITKCIFPIFQNNSVGNLRHGCRIIDHLLRFRLDDVYEVLGKDADTIKRYVGLMMNYIDHAPVADVLLNLVCKPHNPALIRHYSCSPQRKWAFFRALSEWKFLLVLGQRVCSDDHSESQTIAAAEVFCELLDRLAADENGEILLQPAAYCPELLEGFVRIAVDRKVPHTNAQRTAAMKCVLRLLQKSVIEKVQGPPTSPYQSFGATIVNLVPNQLASLRERIYALVENHMEDFLKYLLEKYQDQQNILMNLDSGAPLPETAVKHTSYVCKAPFTELRLTLVLTLVEIASQNPAKLEQHFTTSVWRVLLSWFFEYAQNNLYHAAFYQLVFIAIRSDNKSILEVLIKKLKIITTLIEHYRNDEGTSNKGYILQICNAIRLQASSQSPDSFLRNFLQSHTTWRHFEPELRANTNAACLSGLGFAVPRTTRSGIQKDTWQMIEEIQDDDGIDHGSNYAKSLGFVDDVAWPNEEVSESSKKKKKKKNKGKKSKNGNDNINADDVDMEENIIDSFSTVSIEEEEEEEEEEEVDSSSDNANTKKKNKKKKKKNGALK